ncbi:MAG: hypothetical protein A3K60_05010 [Euryarchaeota archaeon RBG_19FT_COMBO_56_21]|nr:MAG: hypothetical protein A3K60_05010 [Euryarchaeota archaeon RBG_19FT_COMBO_56_21]
MAEKISEHPMLAYLIFVVPMALLAIALFFEANVLILIAITAWLGVAFVILFLPVASDNGSSQ